MRNSRLTTPSSLSPFRANHPLPPPGIAHTTRPGPWWDPACSVRFDYAELPRPPAPGCEGSKLYQLLSRGRRVLFANGKPKTTDLTHSSPGTVLRTSFANGKCRALKTSPCRPRCCCCWFAAVRLRFCRRLRTVRPWTQVRRAKLGCVVGRWADSASSRLISRHDLSPC